MMPYIPTGEELESLLKTVDRLENNLRMVSKKLIIESFMECVNYDDCHTISFLIYNRVPCTIWEVRT